MTGFGSIDQAVQAMRMGAYDFMAKPVDPEHLRLVIERIMRERTLQDEVLQLAGALARTVLRSAAFSAKTRKCTPSSN